MLLKPRVQVTQLYAKDMDGMSATEKNQVMQLSITCLEFCFSNLVVLQSSRLFVCLTDATDIAQYA